MSGLEQPPAWLVADWVLAQFGRKRAQAQARYAAGFSEEIGLPSVWEGLRHQVFLGNEELTEQQRSASKL